MSVHHPTSLLHHFNHAWAKKAGENTLALRIKESGCQVTREEYTQTSQTRIFYRDLFRRSCTDLDDKKMVGTNRNSLHRRTLCLRNWFNNTTILHTFTICRQLRQLLTANREAVCFVAKDEARVFFYKEICRLGKRLSNQEMLRVCERKYQSA